METKKPYNLNLTTPGGKCAAEADTMKDLVEITPRGLFGESAAKVGLTEDQRLDAAARALWKLYLKASKGKLRHYQTKISEAGLELDLMKCYLAGMSVEAAADHLSNVAGTQISASSVGRHWKTLNKVGPEFKAHL